MNLFYPSYAYINSFLPIIIISFFLLDSFIFKNLKGIVFLVGLVFAIMTSIIINNTIKIDNYENSNKLCNPFTIYDISKNFHLPVNPIILLYTFIYLVSIMVNNGFVLNNIAYIFIMGAIIIKDSLWLAENKCFTSNQIVVSSLIGIFVSLLWSYIIHKSNNKSILYTVGVDSNDTCEIPKNKTYKCKYKPNK